ncbi:hypothetical protein YC2023_118272 [Brassica napus]
MDKEEQIKQQTHVKQSISGGTLSYYMAKRISVAPRDDHANSHISTEPVRARVLEQHDDLSWF